MDDAIVCGDCTSELRILPAGCADMVFADPPYGIGQRYDVYDDTVADDEYLQWCWVWIGECVRILRPGGALWVMAHTSHVAAIYTTLVEDYRLRMRNWIVWHYTFGQAQRQKFTPSWVSLLYCVKPGGQFTFNNGAIRVPSARQEVYNDKRANPAGKVPNDVWDGIPRLCGTHVERTPHPCQLPNALLRRAILACTDPGDMVVDPFAGSGTTLAVAKELGRRYFGVELSPAYCDIIHDRLAKIGGVQ